MVFVGTIWTALSRKYFQNNTEGIAGGWSYLHSKNWWLCVFESWKSGFWFWIPTRVRKQIPRRMNVMWKNHCLVSKFTFPYRKHPRIFKKQLWLLYVRITTCPEMAVLLGAAEWSPILGFFFFQLSGIVIADIDEGTVTPHPNAEIPRLPSVAVSLYKFRYFDFAFIAPHTTHTAL